MIRPATFDDIEEVFDVLKDAFKLTPFYGKVQMNELYMRRVFANAVVMPNMFAWVSVTEEGHVDGALGGLIQMNAWGAPIATDIINYSLRDTPRLVRKFQRWAKANGAVGVMLTTESSNMRLDRLLDRLGTTPVGKIHLEVF